MRRLLLYFPIATVLLVFLTATPTLAGSYESGLKVYQDGDYPSAVRYFRDALGTDAQNPNIRYYLADALMRSNRLAEAQTEYQKILATAPYSQAARLSKTALSNIKDYVATAGSRWHLASTEGVSSGTSAGISTETSAETSSSDDKLSGLSLEGGDYLAQVTNVGNYVRWSLKKMPIRVYVERSPIGVTSFQPGYLSAVPKALDMWVRALNGQISYMMVDQPDQADIAVRFRDELDKHGFVKGNVVSFVAGLTSPKISNDQLKQMQVQISTRDIKGNSMSQERLYTTVLHELGHALGLQGHSLNPEDVMFSHSLASELSPRDINTIRHLYMMPADITNLPPHEQTAGKKMINAIALDQSIAQQEAMVKTYGDSLNWLNLGSNYGRKAALAKGPLSGDPTQTQPYWLQKAVNAYTESLKLAPGDPKALSYRADAYSRLGDYNNALSDITASIKADPQNSDLFLEQTNILLKMNRKAEAKNSLNSYKAMTPGAENSDQVKRIEAKL